MARPARSSLSLKGRFPGMSRRGFIAAALSVAGHGAVIACNSRGNRAPASLPPEEGDENFNPFPDYQGLGGEGGAGPAFCEPGELTEAFQSSNTPRFFGAETRVVRNGNGIYNHNKWKDMLRRHREEMRDPAKARFVNDWFQSNFGQYKTAAGYNDNPEVIALKAQQVDHVVDKAVKYIYDKDLYGSNDNDHWATPYEILRAVHDKTTCWGDCEDSAILKYFALRWLGVPTERLYNVHVYTGQDEQGVDWWHIMNMVNLAPKGQAERFVILNNQQGADGQLELESEYKDKYKPLYAMNEKVFLIVPANAAVPDNSLEPLPTPPHRCQGFTVPLRSVPL